MDHSSILKLFNIKIPLLLSPMAGAADSAMAISVAKSGGLGAIACAMLDEKQIRHEVQVFRNACPSLPLNLNFFCHENTIFSEEAESRWKRTLEPYYKEFGLDKNVNATAPQRRPFDEETCRLVEELKPEVVSFHFGLPKKDLLKRVKASGCKVISSATTVEEAVWLEAQGCDGIIAQGFEAGGHRGMFLSSDVSYQVGTIALIPLIVNRVKVPVIAAGGIMDGKGFAAAMILGASAVQMGTAFLLTHETKISKIHQSILLSNESEDNLLTNIFSGKPARSVKNRIIQELGPFPESVPSFPHAGGALAPLKAVTEKQGSGDFMSLWTGQGIGLRKKIISSEDLVKEVYLEAKKFLPTL